MKAVAALVLAAIAASPASAGQMLSLRCANGGAFEARVLVGRGFAEAGMGLDRVPLWCPSSASIETAWLPADQPTGRQLLELAQSKATDEEPLTLGADHARKALKLATVGDLRRILAVPSGGDLLWRGQKCRPLQRYFNGEDFPPCNGPLTVTKLPIHWD